MTFPPAAPSPSPAWPRPVLDAIAAAGDRPVVEDGDRVVTGDELTALIRRAAAGLRSAGAGPGRDVVLRVGVHPEGLAAILAAFAVGATVSGVRADQAAGLSFGPHAVDVDEERLAALLATPDPGGAPPADGRPDDVARILWTSGSTGRPKGCAQTYAAMSAGWSAHPDRWPPPIRELAPRLRRHLVFGSLTSQVILEYAVLTLVAGGVLVVTREPDLGVAITDHEATSSVITVGRLHRLVRAAPGGLPSLRALLVSGSPLAPARLREALRVLGPVVFHGYGQTETGLIGMVTPGEMLADPASLDSVGRPPAGVDVALRDGELYVRTPGQALGYVNDPVESAEVFVDGWVRTRDRAVIGDDGRIRLRGRARDIVIVQAEVIYAGAVERVLASDPAVAEAYVVGRPSETTGEAVHAFIVSATGLSPDPDLLCELVASRLGPNATPRSITVIPGVPVLPSGKPDKSALR